MFIFGKFDKIGRAWNQLKFFSILLIFLLYFCCLSYFSLTWHVSPVLAQQPAPDQRYGTMTGDSLFREMLYSVESCVQISTNIRHQINLFGIEMTGSGKYLEVKQNDSSRYGVDGTGIQFRLELLIQPKPEENRTIPPSNLTVVCDKQYVWKFTSINGQNELSQIEVKTVLEAMKRSGRVDIPAEAGSFYGLGGMAGMLREIQRRYEFTKPPTEEKIVDKFGTATVLKIRGLLKSAELKRLTTSQDGKKQTVPEQCPTCIDICVNSNTFFPFRIDYFQTKDGSEPKSAHFARTEYYDTQLNSGEISNEVFIYRPEAIPRKDTDEYIKQLLTN